MQLRARLVHADDHRRVVEVSAREAERTLGSALGEGATAEEAEDRAIARLRQRLGAAAGPEPIEPPARPVPVRPAAAPPTAEVSTPPEPAAAASPVAPAPAQAQAPAPAPAPSRPTATTPAAALSAGPPQEPPADPDDWSAELAEIELQLRRLGWDREREATYLQRAFGHPSRSRLTTYADLLAYLRALEALEADSDPALAATPLRRRDLLAQSDQLLAQLGWDAERGRSFLEQQLGAASRSQLSDQQLLQFNMALESVWIERALDSGGQAPADEPASIVGR